MIREEALQILDTIPTIGEQVDALEMAIQALSQEPCNDAISREAVLKIIDGWYEQNRDTENIEDLIVLITYMSSVTQKSETVTEFADRCRECGARYGKLLKQKSVEWIPVSERLPEEGQRVLVTQIVGERTVVYGTRFPFEEMKEKYITAWMPLPKPYEPQESEEQTE